MKCRLFTFSETCQSYRKDNLSYNMCASFLQIRLPVAKSQIVTTSKFDRLHAEWPTGIHDIDEEEETCVPGDRVSAERVKTLAFPTIATRIIILPFHETSYLVFVTPDSAYFSSGSLQIQMQS